ncbi:hypothetical protein CAEBREN_01919 [Caenorhabditis brenneri]|uniref:Fe2OG dioxygenase domain-containing protein n=1 Tax=Caenorhabditis brenneri TaxID=135651 RepID=G0N0T4_CAEBE|nr:hypothetical protein CAEBREN_01919 [Caenorhabditis brenneri]
MCKTNFYLFIFASSFLSPVSTYDNDTYYEDDVFEEYFEGEKYWDDFSLNLCELPVIDKTSEWRGAVCVEYLVNFQVVKMEILTWRPALVIYRDLFTKTQVNDYLELMKDRDFEEQSVVDEDGNEFTSKVRKANGTQIVANDYPASRSIFETVKSLIPNLNFEIAEDIIALSYKSAGHYAPHHDYLVYPSENEWDGWMRNYGNRFATLIMVFETAISGGATVFPQLGASVKPNPGDAFFWFNAMGDGEQEDLSEHGGCPIYAGTKQISTIWIRMKEQPILSNLLNSGSIPAHYLFPGAIRNTIFSS